MEYVINHGWALLLIQARFTQFSRGKFIVDVSLRNPQSKNSCDIPFVSVKLPKFAYSQCVSAIAGCLLS